MAAIIAFSVLQDAEFKGETIIILHPPLPLVGVSIWMERGCQLNDRTLADGCCQGTGLLVLSRWPLQV